ncbi:MAG: efflux RND transporter periplasmic adaptor subunit [Polyangiales bacterium]
MDSQPSSPSAVRRVALTALAIVLVAAVGLFVRARTRGSHASAAPSTSSSERVVPVPVAVVAARDLPIVLDAIGSVSAYNTVTVKSQVDGRIDKILFTEGQAVKAGDLLVQIDPRPFAIQLQAANASLLRDKAILSNAKIVLARNENLLKQGVGSQQGVDDAKAEVAKDEAILAGDAAAIATAQLQLDFARIKSPINGVVGVRQVDVGNIVHPSDAGIVVITQVEPIAVFFTLPEDDLPRINAAMADRKLSVDAYSRDGSQKLATGELLLIDNKIDPATATIKLKAIFPNDKRTLWPNQFVKARLALSVKKGAIVVPATVVQRGPQGAYAYVVEDGDKVKLVQVEVELSQGELVVVSKGLSPGDRVVVDGQNQLRPGARIVAKPYAPTSASTGASFGVGAPPPGPAPGGAKGGGKKP